MSGENELLMSSRSLQTECFIGAWALQLNEQSASGNQQETFSIMNTSRVDGPMSYVAQVYFILRPMFLGIFQDILNRKKAKQLKSKHLMFKFCLRIKIWHIAWKTCTICQQIATLIFFENGFYKINGCTWRANGKKSKEINLPHVKCEESEYFMNAAANQTQLKENCGTFHAEWKFLHKQSSSFYRAFPIS